MADLMTAAPRGAGLETKYLAFDRAATLAEDGRIEGYASFFGAEDQGGDVVAPGAFARSLRSLSDAGRAVKLLWQHDPGEPIGVWDLVREDERGLAVTGRLLREVRRGAEAIALLQAGAVDGLSIGYRTVQAERRPGGGRLLTEVELWEVSLVTFPMLPQARAMAPEAEAGADETLEALLAEALSEAHGRP
ncbi:MAG: HK97 family phage prohead protease [Pseudomonadota bacterium]